MLFRSPRYLAIDFGYENPFVCQWWAEDNDGRLYRYREIYVTHQLVADLAPEIVRLTENENLQAIITDHDAEDRATLEKHGLGSQPANKAVAPGIQSVKQRLQLAGDGKPRIFFMRDSLVEADPRLEQAHLPTCTEEEITLYTWQKKAEGAEPKDQPLKKYDHGMDPMRYMSMHFETPGWRMI